MKVSVVVHNYGPSRTLVPEGSLVHGTQTIPLGFPALTLGHDEAASATAIAQVPAPALWSPSAPNLYQLTLAVGREEQLLRERRPAPADLARRPRVPQRRSSWSCTAPRSRRTRAGTATR